MRLLLCACGKQLTGRQRQHCSDRCRKRLARGADKFFNADKKTIQAIKNLDTVDLTTRFFDILSVLSVREFEILQRQMTLSLLSAVEYQEIWKSRCQAAPEKFEKGKVEAHSACAELLRNFLNFVQELRSE